MEAGFASSTITRVPTSARMGAPATSHVAGTGHRPVSAKKNTVGDAVAVAENEAALGAKPALTPEQETIQSLQNARSKLTAPFMGEFMGMAAGGATTWVAGKFNMTRVQTVLRAIFSAPFEALRETTFGTITQFPAHYMNAVARHASDASAGAIKRHAEKAKLITKETGNVAEVLSGIKAEKVEGAYQAQKWSEGAKTAADKLANGAESINARVTGSDTVKTMRSAIGNKLDWLEKETRFGGKLNEMFDGIMHRRSTAAVTRHGRAIAKAEAALTTEAPGFFKSIANFFTRTKPATVAAGTLEPIMQGIKSASDLTGEAKVGALKEVSEQLGTMLRTNVVAGADAVRAHKVAQHLTKAVSSATVAHTYEAAAGESLRQMVKTVGKSLANIKVFPALMVLGATAGLAATVLSARAESKQAKETYKDLLTQLEGHEQSGFMKAVKSSYGKEKYSRFAKTGLEVVGGVADGAFMALPGGGGAAMMGAMMLPQICGTLVPDNPLLGAYEALKQNEAGKLKLPAEQTLELTRHMIAAMPSVEQHGGIYNRLVTPIAKEIESRKLSVREFVQLLADDSKFTAFAAEVNQKQQAKAEQAKAGKDALAAHAETPNKPATRISTGVSAKHEGTIQQHALARA